MMDFPVPKLGWSLDALTEFSSGNPISLVGNSPPKWNFVPVVRADCIMVWALAQVGWLGLGLGFQILKFGANFFHNFLEFLKSQNFLPPCVREDLVRKKHLDHETKGPRENGQRWKNLVESKNLWEKSAQELLEISSEISHGNFLTILKVAHNSALGHCRDLVHY